MRALLFRSLWCALVIILSTCSDNPSVCGDGVSEGIEECDDGNLEDGDGVNDTCDSNCTITACGNGVPTESTGEECDDGLNNLNTGACTSQCLTAKCGDGFVLSGVEECDDGNSLDGDGCDSCTTTQCGNGITTSNTGEECDDDNLIQTDGCTNLCKLPACGDGFQRVDITDQNAPGFEACDDGNQNNTDNCVNINGQCRLAACGDALVENGVEECDDANQLNTDNCLVGCVAARCGDGFVRAGVEGCDDGNTIDNDGCRNNCTLPNCGDGVVQPGEDCDDQNTNNNDACLNTCRAASCGDNFVQSNAEQCDDGNQNSADSCVSCQQARCGDGFIQSGVEECDDANQNNTDDCVNNNGACRLARCGDGIARLDIVDPLSPAFEECDDGNQSNLDSCTNTCQSPSCGDGFRQILNGEECDDGNSSNDDACLNACIEAQCGDGFSQAINGEACDDGNQNNLDSCTNDCSNPTCGDGFRQASNNEECDDGNTNNNDACSNACQSASCGDGIVQTGELCDDADQDEGDDCPSSCLSAFCGDGFVRIGVEDCDPNDVGGPPCSASCTRLCGDGILDIGLGEVCDDGNSLGADGCNQDCTLTDVVQLAAGTNHTCSLFNDGNVKCWGRADEGQLGYGNLQDIGDDELPADVGVVDLGAPAIQITAGKAHTCALLETGNVRCWGQGTFGQLGYGNTDNIGDDETPASAGDVNVGGVVTQITAGDSHTCALLNTGNVRCWGSGNRLGYGNATTIGDNETPASVTTGLNGTADINLGATAVQISAGSFHTCALVTGGNVRCWGVGAAGQLGYGNTTNIGDNETPASVTTGAGGTANVNIGASVSQITAGGSHTCALITGGNVRCWGEASSGQLGYANINKIGDTETPASAGNINLGGPVAQISAGGFHTCAILTNDNLRCWGLNSGGGLGYSNTNNIGDDETPASAGDVNLRGSASQVELGFAHTCALLTNGILRCWGFNAEGQLGFGNQQNMGDNETPGDLNETTISGLATQISAGLSHTCALLNGGQVRCWGRADSGQLGYGNASAVGLIDTPASVGAVDIAGTALQVEAGGSHSCALLVGGGVRCWGNGFFGQLGQGNNAGVGVPSSVGVISLGGAATQISSGESHNCALLADKSVRCWGLNDIGQLGYSRTDNIGDTELPSSVGPVSVGGFVDEIASGREHTCARLVGGSVRCWGRASQGQLGYGNFNNNIGDNEFPSSVGPVSLGGVATQIVAGGFHTCALLSDGAVRCWGLNSSGQLGYGNLTNIGDTEQPSSVGTVDVGGIVTQITAGFVHTCALLSDGTVRCWGSGASGQLGYGNANNIGDNELPSSVGVVDVGGTVVEIKAGTNYTCARLSDGNIRCWGEANQGQLGYGNSNDIGDTEAPAAAGNVSLGVLSDLKLGGEHSCALFINGSVFCWGKGSNGRLGYGNTNNIGDNERAFDGGALNLGGAVTQLSAGSEHSCAIVGGSVRCWGKNASGQLGIGNTNDIGDTAGEMPPAAVNLGAGVTAIQVVAAFTHTCALTNTNAVKCWGRGIEGQLGLGILNPGANGFVGDAAGEMPPANTNVLTAAEVSAGIKVTRLSAKSNHTCALLSSGDVRCWGFNPDGRLGNNNTNTIGDDEAPNTPSNTVVLGAFAIDVSAGGEHTCALINTGDTRCWGSGALGQLGYSNTNKIGDDELPAVAGDVNVGGFVVEVAAGALSTCVLLDTGEVRCWGSNFFGSLGYGNVNVIGDNESPSSAGSIFLGSETLSLGVGDFHSCAALDDGKLRCWGANSSGQLGNSSTADVGGDKLPVFDLSVRLF